jgi:hypothetical protein
MLALVIVVCIGPIAVLGRNARATYTNVGSSCRPWSVRLSRSIQEHRLHIVQNFAPASFSIYTACVGEILMIEDELIRHLIPLKQGDLPDGSIGKRWPKHCREQGLGQEYGFAPLEMPHIDLGDGRPLIVQVMVNDSAKRWRFDQWLNETYLPLHMPEYFKNKWKAFKLPAASAADNASKRLTGRPAAITEEERRAIASAGGIITAETPPPQLK